MSVNNVYGLRTPEELFAYNMQMLYSYSGLAGGNKPGTMLSPMNGAKVSRTTATVLPLSHSSPTDSSSLHATRTSSFAAALRKLAKQAVEPGDEVSSKHNSPSSTNSDTSPVGSSTPKQVPRAAHTSTVPPPSSSTNTTPVVAIAPTQTRPSMTTVDRQSREASVAESASSGHSMNIKQERSIDQRSGHPSYVREDDGSRESGQARSRHTPRSTHSANPAASLSHHPDNRGFQPYHHGGVDDPRQSVVPPMAMDPAYAYHTAALMQQHPYTHPALRLDDPMMLERYHMMQAPYVAFAHPGMLPHPAYHSLLASGRYPAEYLQQQYMVSPTTRHPTHPSPVLDRQRIEEERRKEIEEREKELERERERERERKEMLREREKERELEKARERERSLQRERERLEREAAAAHERRIAAYRQDYEARYRGQMSPAVHHGAGGTTTKHGSITHGTPRDLSHYERHGPYNPPHPAHHDARSHHHGNPAPHHTSKLPVHHHGNLPGHPYTHSGHHGSASSASNHPDKPRGYVMPTNDPTHHPSQHHPESSGLHWTQQFESKYLNTSSDTTSRHPTALVVPKLAPEKEASKPEARIYRPFEASDSKPQMNVLVNGYDSRSHRDWDAAKKHPVLKERHPSRDNGVPAAIFPATLLSAATVATPDQFPAEVYKADKAIVEQEKDLTVVSSDTAAIEEARSRDLKHKYGYTGEILHREGICSKLDLEARRLRAARRRGEGSAEESEEEMEYLEERRVQKLMLVTSGPSMDLEFKEDKIDYMRSIGLVTITKKKEIEFTRIRNRRRLLREPSLSPEIMEAETRSFLLPITSRQSIEDLRRESGSHDKTDFLYNVGLGSCTSESSRGVKRKHVDIGHEFNEASKSLSREFAQEFHDSVLQATLQRKQPPVIGEKLTMTSSEESLAPYSQLNNQSNTRWPGIESVIESYHRYNVELSSEKRLLSEQCEKLQADYTKLSSIAEEMSAKLDELITSKQQSGEERAITQRSIDKLRQSVIALR